MVALAEIAAITAGQSPPGSTYNEVGEGLPFFQGKADFGTTHPTARKWCTAPKKIAEAGDILISVRAPVGPTNIAVERCCIGRGLAAIRPDDKAALPAFVHWVLKHRRPELAARATGSTFTAVRQKDLRSLLVPLPPMDEQRRIVDILNRAARIEALRTRAADRLREFVPALFVSMFGDPGRNPMRWPQRAIGDVCEVQGGLQVSKKRSVYPLETPYLRVANVLRDRLVLDAVKLMRLTETELARTRLLPGDLLVVEGHGNATEIGRVAVWDGRIPNCVHQNHLIRARTDQSRLLPAFAAAYLNSSSGRQHLLGRGKTTSGLNTITTSDVRTCGVFVPPLDLQRRYAEFVKAAVGLARVGESRQEAAAALLESLMSRLMSLQGVRRRSAASPHRSRTSSHLGRRAGNRG
jgi:type I restriction enzyme S subunit